MRSVKLGDSVTLYTASRCEVCEFCLTDREYLCAGLSLMEERKSGTYAE